MYRRDKIIVGGLVAMGHRRSRRCRSWDSYVYCHYWPNLPASAHKTSVTWLSCTSATISPQNPPCLSWSLLSLRLQLNLLWLLQPTYSMKQPTYLARRLCNLKPLEIPACLHSKCSSAQRTRFALLTYFLEALPHPVHLSEHLDLYRRQGRE